MASLLTHFDAAVERHPDRIAIVDGTGWGVSYRQLQTRVGQLARRWQQKGIRQGDRVLLAMPVGVDLYASLAALWSLGATIVLPEPAMGLEGLRHATRTTQPKAFCASGVYTWLRFLLPKPWQLRLLRPGSGSATPGHASATVQGDDVALISFTSGTTGQPKAIPRSHAFLMAQHDAIAPLLHSQAEERDLVAFPVFTLINLAAGRTTVLPNWKMTKLDRVAPDHLSGWIAQQNVTRALLPPALCETLAQGRAIDGFHTVFTGGGPIFPDLVEKLQGALGLRVTCVYGSTEAEPIAHLAADEISPTDQQDMIAGKGLLVGHPVPQIRLRICDDEIQVAGDHVNDGYQDPAHAKDNKIPQDGVIWHRTGDAGALDDHGRLWLWGRLNSDVATPQGRIYPFAIEVAAKQWPGVEVSALIAVDGNPLLCVQGNPDHLPDWRSRAEVFGVQDVRPVKQIPMDKRHRSKVDRAKLLRSLRG